MSTKRRLGSGGIIGARGRVARLGTLILVACLASGLAAALSSALAGSPTPTPPDKTILRVGWTDDPESLNPFVGQMGTALEVYFLNYDCLTKFDAKTLTPKSGLATSWIHSDDGRTWTFSLRRNVTWQDGRPFTSKDVAFTFDYIIKNEMGAYTGYTTFIERVVALDPYTVRFDCSRPKANMLDLAVPILPAHVWSDIDPRVAADTYRNSPPVIGTGPFQVVEYRPNKFVRLAANSNYWGGAPGVDEVIFQIYQNPDTMQMDLRSGAIQAAVKLPLAQLAGLRGDKDLDLSTQNPQRIVHDLGFNCYTGAASQGNPVLLDPAFRRALNYAVDKEQICRVAYFGLARPAETTLVSHYWVDPDWHWAPPPDVRYRFDLERAKAELDAAGYRDTDGDGVRDVKGTPITLRLWAIATEPNEQAAGKLITGWLQQIGLKIKYEALDTGALMDRMWDKKGKEFAPDYDLFLWGWNSELDPNFTLSVFTTGEVGSWSDTNWSNEEYDRLFERQQSTIDPVQRKQIVDRMQELMYRETPMIFLAEPSRVIAWDVSRWEGWVRAPAEVGAAVGARPIMDSYLFVRPRAASALTQSGTQWPALIVAAVAACVAAVAVVGLRARRSRLRPSEETES
ncbi:MAG TPA: ABC transporter substrate-binding protein [Thermoleophilia bacterium]|nr:ABC transporter substrate-binding protein [Thermoleophilia bacterium]